MKKIIFVVMLSLLVVTGCNFHKEENKEVNYESYVTSDNTYIKTVEKDITLNGNKHTLAFIYSKGNGLCAGQGEVWNCQKVYGTVLLDGELLNSEFNNKVLYQVDADKAININEYEIEFGNINDKLISNNYLALVTAMDDEGIQIAVIYDENGKQLQKIETPYHFDLMDSHNEPFGLKVNNNSVKTVYVDNCDDMGIITYTVENGSVKVEKSGIPDGYSPAGGC